jgi:phosphoribosylaminoimidazole-succinocarboxamide synthase
MPDLLPGKGEALAVMAAHLFEQIEMPETWKEFSRTPEALALRRGNRSGGIFIELGERLQSEGLRTHYFGLLKSPALPLAPSVVGQLTQPASHMVVKRVGATRPKPVSVMGQALWDYSECGRAQGPRLIPLEVVFRWSVPEGSSILSRAAGMGLQIQVGHQWEFPFIELFTKLESTDRLLGLGEAFGISGISGEKFQEILFKTAWVAGYLRSVFSRLGLELADGKLEWGISDTGEIWLVDAIGPDELRILSNGIQLSKEFLRNYYRPSNWYQAIGEAKKQAAAQGVVDWKRFVTVKPEPLPSEVREVARALYPALTHALMMETAQKSLFPEAQSLDSVMGLIQGLSQRGSR